MRLVINVELSAGFPVRQLLLYIKRPASTFLPALILDVVEASVPSSLRRGWVVMDVPAVWDEEDGAAGENIIANHRIEEICNSNAMGDEVVA